MNGCIYWLNRSRSRVEKLHGILCFDLRDENFRVLQLPLDLQQGNIWVLKVLGGCLVIIKISHDIEFQLWTMKNDSKEEWIKVISMYNYTRHVCISKNGEVVVLARSNGSNQLKFMLYDPKRDSIEEFHVHGFTDILSYEEITYIESLVSPNFE